MRRFPLIALVAVLSSVAVYVSGQAFQGALRGRIADSKDAIIPLAKVTLIEEATAVSSSTLTNEQGEYSFPVVNPGTYTLQVESPGFKKLEQKGILISTQTAVVQDAKLEIGQVNETVNVTAEASVVETGEASTGQVLDRQMLEDLPNLGRNPYILARLSEAVVWTGNPKFDRMEDQSGSSQLSIAGGPTQTNNYTLDGISITDSTNRAVIIPSQEAVEEVKVQANTYDAEMGRTGGGVFNTTLRSGSNRMHGSLFGTVQETSWLANNFFANRAGQAIPDQPFKNYGDSLGGPVRLPKIYDGRNKTFFYVATEGYRQFDAASGTLAVPTALERIGNFSQSMSNQKNGLEQVMFDPLSTNLTTGARTAFPNNIIPTAELSQIGLNLASFYPLPNGPTTYYGQPNYTYTVRTQDRADQGTFKLDHSFFTWLKASASYLHYGSTEPSNQTFPGDVGTPGQNIIYRHVDAAQANATATINPTTVFTVRFGQNRFPDYEPNISNGFPLTALGFPAAVNKLTPNYPDFPSISNGDFTSYGGGTASWTVYYSQTVNAGIIKQLGKHSLKAGFDFRSIHNASQTSEGPSSFSFASTFTSQTPTKTVLGTGGGLATQLLGYPGGSITLGNHFNDYVHYSAFYIQDDYRITKKLTVNIGFRGEHESNPAEASNKYLIDAVLNEANPLQSSVPGLVLNGISRYAGLNGDPNHAGNPLGLKLGPRIGFAYAIDSKTAIRGGYGIFWIPQSFGAQNALGYSYTTNIVTSTNNNYTPISSLINPYPNGLTQPSGNLLGSAASNGMGITVTDPGNRSAGYVEQMSFDIQRQIDPSTVISAGYIGSHTLDQPFTLALNQLNPSYFSLGSTGLAKVVTNPFYGLIPATVTLGSSKTLAESGLLTQYPEFTSVSLSTAMGRATYYSFYIKGQKRFKHGMTLLATYDWSRNMSLSGTVQNYDAPIVPQAWTRSPNDQPNSYSMSFTYQLPFGKGQMFMANTNRFVDYFLGGWSVQGQQLIHSGTPLSVSQTNANTGCNGCGQLPNATGASALTPGSPDQRINDWLNLAAFTPAPAYTFGNVASRLNVYSPSLFNLDASIYKSVTIKEYYKVQFRAEALNLTNTVLFASPSTNISSPGTFGVITSQTNFPRLIRLGVRFTF